MKVIAQEAGGETTYASIHRPRYVITKIKRVAAAMPGAFAPEIAKRVVRDCAPADVRELAEAYVANEVEALRRQSVRIVEQAAVTSSAPKVVIPPAQADDGFARFRDDPIAYSTPPGAKQRYTYFSNSPGRKQFRRWMGAEFQGWYDQHHRRVARLGDATSLERFEQDWHEAGVRAYLRDQMLSQLDQQMRETIARESERIRLEVTEKLLRSTFAVGDGTRVTWGDATVEQHEQRIGMLTRNASVNVETAMRHQAAIQMIRDAGATCLAEVQS